jgi:two-component system, cell cycle sensor histidine kinase and response regulator CckA
MNVLTHFPATRDYSRDLPFQAIFEGAAIGIAICQLDGGILEANPALCRMLGCSPQELAGRHAFEFQSDPRPEFGHENGAGLLSVSVSERLLVELLRGDRNSFEIENRYRRKDGSSLCLHLTISLGRDAHRQDAFLIAMLADATERKQVEAHLREAEKMEVIGRLAGGIAHDFNNLLTGILLYCDLLSAGLEKGDSDRLGNDRKELSELSQHVEEVRRAGEQGAALTHQLLAIARKQSSEPLPIAINETVASTENLLRRLIGEQIELVVSRDSALDAATALVLADPAQLRQVLLNLVLNARDALPQGGRITVSTRAAAFSDARPTNGDPKGKSGAQPPAVALVVSDNGCGMDEQTRSRLFEPFFTTKKPGEGTGLGLATVQRIVSESGGTIKVESTPGRGTSVEVLFPLFGTTSAQLSKIGHAQKNSSIRQFRHTLAQTSRKTILLVDDHAPARKSMQRLLLDAGFHVHAASSAKQALKLFSEHSQAPDLLIADFMMPGMSGQELAETLLRRKPGLKILLVSGYQDAPPGSAAHAVDMIRKPFSGTALIERVVEVMHREVS